MQNWRDTILKEFTPHVAKITIAADPDILLSEEQILEELQSREFNLIVYEEPVSFRYWVESNLQIRIETDASKELIVLLHSAEDGFKQLPFDIVSGSRKLIFGLDRLFPQLNRAVLLQLDRSLLDTLFQAQQIYLPLQLSENATKDFILHHVFEIAPEIIKTPSDLLRILLRKHYREQKFPLILDDWLIQLFQKGGRFNDWPLEEIVKDRSAFYAYLQERWPAYINTLENEKNLAAHEFAAVYHPMFSGPAILPFEHDDIRVYMDNLFAEGWLKPISPLELPQLATNRNRQNYPAWVKMGIHSDPETERYIRLQKILQTIEEEFNPDSAQYTDWLSFAPRWAEANALWYSPSKTKQYRGQNAAYEPLQLKYNSIRAKIDTAFSNWLLQRYGTLYNMPIVEPIMVHQIPRFMARKLQNPNDRIALVIIDGLSFDQWVVVNDTLKDQLKDFKISVHGSFAWIPTLTSVSRQSIFAGKPPMYFPDRIEDTKSEKSLWTQFWSDTGLTEHQVCYQRLMGNHTKLEHIKEELSDPQVRVAGLVLDKVDKIMHGMELGALGMLNQVRQWVEQGDLINLIQYLVENHYKVLISSDHGNIESTGFGRPNEGATADLRGERVRVYRDENLRKSVKANFPQALEWKPLGLPPNYFPLFAPNRSAFVQNGKITVCHGGISIEEVIVPFVQIERR